MAVKLNPRLGPAIAVFRELGWAQAPIGTAPDLPLGTPEQRRIAVAGLASGQWSEFGELGNGRWGRISAIDVDETMLAIFAIRAGVDARRAVTIVPRVDDELIARIVGERGPAFAVRFIDGVCRASLRMWEHSCSFHGGAAVRLVADLRLEVPQNVDYLKDWVALALEQVAIELRDASDGRQPPRDPATAWRFMEHLAAAAALGVPATGPFGRLVPLAVSGGWIERDAAVALSFQALDSAQRRGIGDGGRKSSSTIWRSATTRSSRGLKSSSQRWPRGSREWSNGSPQFSSVESTRASWPRWRWRP